ncbi:class I SAM-dependent methyltransferase [bacterium]|nr:class I SAM-dependent methyltransferase [bacterium]
MDRAVLENHKIYEQRKKIFKSFGYDGQTERDLILEKAGLFKGKILEAGTGKGRFTLTLAQAGYSVMSIDISVKEQAIAKLNLQYFEVDDLVDLKIENVESLSFKDASFDIIFSVNTIHHLANPLKMVDELLRVIKPGGKIVLSDFSKQGMRVMDKIHLQEKKNLHDGKETLPEVEGYFKSRNIKFETYNRWVQKTLIALI